MDLKNKIVLITGGTGSLGKGLLRRINAKEIRVLSRSEIGQDELRAKYPKVKFILGDVKDYHSVRDAVRGVDVVIHAAAFKYIDLAEKQARECALTNVLGSINVIDAVKDDGNVKVCIGISTDKVTNARNVYGCTKHIMEKLFKEANNSKTKFCCVRYGNVIGTNGSVFNIWKRQKNENNPLTITDKRMTRFFFSLDEAMDLIFYAINHTKGGETFVRLMPSFSIYKMAKKYSSKIIEIGLRPGEKLHECLVADYEGEEYTSENIKKDTSKIIKI